MGSLGSGHQAKNSGERRGSLIKKLPNKANQSIYFKERSEEVSPKCSQG